MAEWKALGAVFYCLNSLALSVIFGAAVTRFDALRLNSEEGRGTWHSVRRGHKYTDPCDAAHHLEMDSI